MCTGTNQPSRSHKGVRIHNSDTVLVLVKEIVVPRTPRCIFDHLLLWLVDLPFSFLSGPLALSDERPEPPTRHFPVPPSFLPGIGALCYGTSKTNELEPNDGMGYHYQCTQKFKTACTNR